MAAALVDEWMPCYDEISEHRLLVAAPRERVYRCARRLQFGDSPVIRALFALRGLPALFTRRPAVNGASLRFQRFVENVFTVLDERPGEEFVLGLAGQPWTPNGGLRPIPIHEFRAFADERYAKMIWSFHTGDDPGGATLLSTQTRIQCFSATSRKRFRRYWRIIGPFSGIVRMEVLRSIRRQATS